MAAGRHRHSARRRGSNAIEFALILPVFLLLVSVVFEYGFYFFTRTVVAKSVREGCRTGAVIPPDSSPSPEEVAEGSIKDGVAGYSFFGADCASTDDSRCEVSVSTTGGTPNELLNCSMTLAYSGLTGAIPVPEVVGYSSIALLEVQR